MGRRRDSWSDREPIRRPTVVGWGEVRRMTKAFPGGTVFFDLFNAEGDMLDSAVVQDGEGRQEFARRVALDYEADTGAPLPPGCKLVYSEVAG